MKRSFLLLGVLFFLLEPFAVHSGLFLKAGPQVCASCGMKDVCGAVCCCVEEQTCGTHEREEGVSFRSVDCAPDRPALAPTFSDMAKLLPCLPSPPLRVERLSDLDLMTVFIPRFSPSPVHPPPESTVLS